MDSLFPHSPYGDKEPKTAGLEPDPPRRFATIDAYTTAYFALHAPGTGSPPVANPLLNQLRRPSMSNQSPRPSGKDQFPNPPMEKNQSDDGAPPNSEAEDHGVGVEYEDDGLNEDMGDDTRE